jgi:hypothetical protein
MNTLGDWLIAMMVFYFLVMAIWIFISIFANILRSPDLSGGGKAGWVLLIFVLPFFGCLFYILSRPSGSMETAARGSTRTVSPA